MLGGCQYPLSLFCQHQTTASRTAGVRNSVAQYSPAVWLWTSYLTPLGLCCLICETKIIASTANGCGSSKCSRSSLGLGRKIWRGQLEMHRLGGHALASPKEQSKPGHMLLRAPKALTAWPEKTHPLEISAKPSIIRKKRLWQEKSSVYGGDIPRPDWEKFVIICEGRQSPVVILMKVVFIHLKQGR